MSRSTASPASTPRTCARSGCEVVLERRARGRPRLYCSAACRLADRRRYPGQPLRIEVDHATDEASGRPTGHVWLVRLRRGERVVEVAAGLGRPSAEYLARQISELLDQPPLAKGGAMR